MDIAAALNASALGIHRNVERLNVAAAEIAKPDNVSDVESTVEMMVAQHGMQANVNAFKAATHMNRSMLDLMA